MRNLPLGISDFSTIRNPSRNFIYVDKTAQIAEMVRMFPAVFIARPRRFGKSLLSSTLRDLFGKGIECFEGLDIAKTWTDTTYKVVSLDFSAVRDVETLEDFLLAFDLHLQGRLRAAGIETSPDVSRFPLERWETALLTLPNSSLVLLIDEYDAPLTECLHLPKRFEQYRRVIASFFARTKSLSGALRFLCVTGVIKFKQNVLTPSFNALTDLSMMPQYGSLLGFTEDELRAYFSPWLERASDLCGMSHDQLISRMRREYGGFCFDQNALTHVFAPWSVLQFLACPRPDFQHYWLNPGGTMVIVRDFLKVRGLLDPAHYDKPFLEDLTVIASDDPILELQPTSVLVHTGYLTIKKATGDGAVMLGYPNEEVREAMGQLLCTSFWPTVNARTTLSNAFFEAIDSKDSHQVMLALNAIVHQLDYKDFSLTSECAVRQLIHIFCLGAGVNAKIELHSPRGRSDLEFSRKKFEVVFEFKHVKKAAQAPDALAQALEQIQTRNYGAQLPGHELLRFGIVFAEDERKFCEIGQA